MIRKWGKGLACTGLIWMLAAGGAAAADHARTITIGDQTRTYTVFIPDRVRAAKRPVAAVFVLHGGYGTGKQVRDHLSFDAIAEREGVIAVYPDGLNRSWNDGRKDLQKRRGVEPDDVGFLTAIARSLKEEKVVLAGETYALGISNGGMMAFRLACEAGGEFDGIVTIIANLGLELSRSCRPSRPIPIMMMQATKDPLMPWSGGGIGFFGKRGEVISADATVAFWGKVLECQTNANLSELPHRLAEDVTRTRHERYACKSKRLERLVIVDGGHQVARLRASPVSNAKLPQVLVGPASHDFDAGEMAWRFLSASRSR